MREIVVPMWTLIGKHSCTRRELVVKYAWTSREQCGSPPSSCPQNGTMCHDKIVAKSHASVKLALQLSYSPPPPHTHTHAHTFI